jgi:hypothetical protein
MILRIAAFIFLLLPLAFFAWVMDVSPGTLGLLLLVPFLLHLFYRLLTLGALRRLMMSRLEPLLASPEEAEMPAAGGRPASPLAFLFLDGSAAIPLTAEQQAQLGRLSSLGERTLSILKKALGISFLALLSLIAAASIFCLASGGECLPIPLAGALPILLVQNLLLFLVLRLSYASLHRVPLGLALWLYFFVTVLLKLTIFSGGLTDWLGLAAANTAGVVILLRGFARLDRELRAAGDSPLLVLRVFGADASTVFVFGELLRRWCFLGSFATIADPSYLRFETSLARRETRRHLWVFASIYLVWVVVVAFVATFRSAGAPVAVAAALGSLGWQGRLELVTLATALLAFAPIALLVALRVSRTFRQTRERLALGDPELGRRVAGGRFLGVALHCHDDVWRKAVNALLPGSAAVLMDVRGFSPERRGCEYELRLLLDRYPVGQILLLADDGPHRDALLELLRGQWERLAADSPNRAAAEPALKIYTPRAGDRRDVERILAFLTTALPSAVAGAEAAVKLPAAPEIGRTAPAKGLGPFTRLDLALSGRATAPIAIPAIVLAILAIAAWRLAPAIGIYRDLRVPAIEMVATCAERAASPAPCPETAGAAPPAARIVVDRLQELLPGAGLVRLSHPRLEGLGELDLYRTGATSKIAVRAKGPLAAQASIHFAGLPSAPISAGDDEEWVPLDEMSPMTLYQPGLFRQEISLAHLQGGAWLEIGLEPKQVPGREAEASAGVELEVPADLVRHLQRGLEIRVADHQKAVGDQGLQPAAAGRTERQQVLPDDRLAPFGAQLFEAFDFLDAALALGPFVDVGDVVEPLHVFRHAAVDHGFGPAAENVDVAGVVHLVDLVGPRRAAADLAEDHFPVGLAVPFHVGEAVFETERR